MSVTQSTTAMHTGIRFAFSFLGDFQVTTASVSKRVPIETFYMKMSLIEMKMNLQAELNFALRLVLMQRQRATE